MNKSKAWIHAFRLRTLPLSFSSILSGAAFAWYFGELTNGLVVFLALLTTLFLQILSNLANDYGDSKNGVDNTERIGPERAVQSGTITLHSMKIALVVFSFLSFLSGLVLVLVAFTSEQYIWVFTFLGFGVLSIWAAIKYTVGNNPYGYRGFGDVFVFVFFGVLGVCGSYFLFAHSLNGFVVFWSFAMGLFSAGVLNVNNMRDIENDKKSGKFSLPVKMGLQNAKWYHYTLITSGLIFVAVVTIQLKVRVPLVSVPLFIWHLSKVSKANSSTLDPELKRLSLTTFFCAVLLLVNVIFA